MKIGKIVQSKKWMFLSVLFIAVFIASVALAQSFPTVVPESIGLSSERLNQIDSLLKADIEKGIIPGAVVLVARKGKLAYFRSFGLRDKEKGLPMEKDSIFRAYSMTKPLIGVASAILLEEGKMVLNEPVSKYIPAFKDVKVAVYEKDDAGNMTRTTVPPPSYNDTSSPPHTHIRYCLWMVCPKILSKRILWSGPKIRLDNCRTS